MGNRCAATVTNGKPYKNGSVRCAVCGIPVCDVSTRCRPCANRYRADKTAWPTGSAHHAWKGDAATDTVKRKRARRRYQPGPSERGGESGGERNHPDGET